MPFKRILLTIYCGSIPIVFLENYGQKTKLFNPYCLLRKFSPKDNTVQPILSFEKNFDQKTIRFNPYCLLRKFWPKDNTVQPILSFKKIFTKRQYGSIHIVFLENFDQKTKQFNPYSLCWKFWPKTIWFNTSCLLRKFSPKDNMVEPILSFKKILTKSQYGLNDIVF